MARIRRSKTNTMFFSDIPKQDSKNSRWKKNSEENDALFESWAV